MGVLRRNRIVGDTLGRHPDSGITYARDPAEAVEVLDLLLKFLGDGERRVNGRLSDRRRNRCPCKVDLPRHLGRPVVSMQRRTAEH
jgi:hypothetical protein